MTGTPENQPGHFDAAFRVHANGNLPGYSGTGIHETMIILPVPSGQGAGQGRDK